MQRTRITRIVLSMGILFGVIFVLSGDVQAQNFKLDEYLKRKDANNNGRIDKEEMSDNMRGFLGKMGFDTAKPISIKKIVSKASRDKKEAASKEASKNRTRKVPGFGVEKSEEKVGVARFGASESDSGSSSKKSKYSESVMKQVNDTLARYDRNKNGMLDRKELEGARWGSPSPQQSDTNKDGRLTRTELAERYASREKYYRDSRGSDRGRGRDSRRRGEDNRDRRGRDDERSRDNSRTATSSRSSSRPTSRTSSSRGSSARSSSARSSSARSSRSSSSRSSSSKSSDSAEKYEKYADSLVSQYDEDKDGKLSKTEIKKMRRPPAGADADKDGFITKSELLASLSGDSKSSSGSDSSSSSDKEEKRSRGSARSGGSVRSYSKKGGSSSSFEKLDANADQHVQMHEFSGKWDDDKVNEFYEKDKNGDGVITLREWTGKN